DSLVELDTTLIDAQIAAAEAAVAWAEAGLAQAKAGARPGQIEAAEAQLAQAEAAHVAATQAVSDTLALVENPQDIRLQIAVMQAQIEAAGYQVERATALKDAAEVAKNTFEGAQDTVNELGGPGRSKVYAGSGSIDDLADNVPPGALEDLPELDDGVYTIGDLEVHKHGDTFDIYKWVNIHVPFELHLTPNKWWQAWVGVNAATAQQEGLQASLAQLYAQRQHPQTLEAKADEALAALAQSEAQIAIAQAQLNALKAGPSAEQIAALESRVAEARAALDSLLAQRTMMAITAPMDGVVIDVVAHRGEVAAPAATLLTIADLSQVNLVAYLPETQIARVRHGQPVQVTVDTFPNQVFTGQIANIASQAEFTPRNVATREERVTLVYAVEIRLDNDDGLLKPGMPAEVAFDA
ncbi:MAG TPA: efflux RND transporter periplasmic adaptor subunit, partial [Anaerolineae bacterium]